MFKVFRCILVHGTLESCHLDGIWLLESIKRKVDIIYMKGKRMDVCYQLEVTLIPYHVTGKRDNHAKARHIAVSHISLDTYDHSIGEYVFKTRILFILLT